MGPDIFTNPPSVKLNVLMFTSSCDIYIPLEQLPKQRLKFRNKLYMTREILKSIYFKHKLFTNYMELKDLALKAES